MTELSRYRQFLGMTALPSPNEATPLVLPIGGTAGSTTEPDRIKTEGPSQRPLTRAALHTIVKDVFAGAAGRLRERGEAFAARADLLGPGRPRRTGRGTDNQVDLRLVRDNLGHASLTTTSLYLHVDEDRRHHETDEKHRIDW